MKLMLTESPLLRDLEHVYIPSYFNEDIFNIRRNALDRERYGISEDDFVVIFGAVNVEEKRKGYKYLIYSLLDYQNRFGTEKIVLLTMGMGSLSLKQADLKMKHIHLGPLNLETERAVVYNICDVLISPSTEDMGPALLVEAMLCGLPAISFDVGVAKDIIKDGINGYIAEFENYIDISAKLHKHKELSKELRKKIEFCARSEVVSVFLKSSYDKSIKEILN
jgi:glycosyltransferase involved in cell wall biosynthesis